MSSSGVLGTSQLAADERKRKRMISNRKSAKQFRERKRQQMDDLTNQVAQLQFQSGQIEMQVNLWKQQWVAVESENRVLRAQLNELSKRLQWLNLLLGIRKEMNGIAAAQRCLTCSFSHGPMAAPLPCSNDHALLK